MGCLVVSFPSDLWHFDPQDLRNTHHPNNLLQDSCLQHIHLRNFSDAACHTSNLCLKWCTCLDVWMSPNQTELQFEPQEAFGLRVRYCNYHPSSYVSFKTKIVTNLPTANVFWFVQILVKLIHHYRMRRRRLLVINKFRVRMNPWRRMHGGPWRHVVFLTSTRPRWCRVRRCWFVDGDSW